MKILVTGSTGYIGRYICEFLVTKGHEVYALARSEKKFKEKQVQGIMVLGSITPAKKLKWIEELPGNLDAVVHAAGLTHSLRKNKLYKENTKNTKRLIFDLEEKYKSLRFILISSIAAAGPSEAELPLVEDIAPNPVSHYGHSKYQAEVALEEYAPEDWKRIILRPPMILGPDDPALLSIFKMIKRGFMCYPSSDAGEKEYSFISIYDMARVVNKCLCLKSKTNCLEILYPSYPVIAKYKEIVKAIKVLLLKEKITRILIPTFLMHILSRLMQFISVFLPFIDSHLTPDKISEITQDHWTCDSSKSQNLLNFSYKWDLESTLESAFESYNQNKKL